MPATPKVIHFVWAGGTRPLPKEDSKPEKSSHHIIENWAKANPGFQPILWVDGRSLPKAVSEAYRKRGYQFRDDINKVIKAQFAPSDGVIKPIVVADIQSLFEAEQTYLSSSELTLLKEAVNYEMEKFHPNYGSSSDLLRYLILTVYGGAYFDSDVPPGKNFLHAHSAFTQEEPCFNVTGRSQGRSNLGNDAFICSPAHPTMILLLQSCLQNFIQLRDYQNPEQFNTYTYLLNSTLRRTGPEAVHFLLNRLNIIDDKDRFLSPSYRLGDPYTALDQSNTNHWLSFPTQSSASLEEAIKRAVKAMDFEMRYLKVCRHSDYVRDMSLSLREPLLALLKANITTIKDSHRRPTRIYDYPLVEHFKSLTETYVTDKIKRSDEDKRSGNFNRVLQDLKKHLEGNKIELNKIKRILIKLEERYHPSHEARSKDKFNILLRLLDQGKGGALGYVLAEENILIKLFDKEFELPSEELKSAYMKLLKIANGISGLISEHFPIVNHVNLVSAQHISYLLDIINPDIQYVDIEYEKSESIKFECKASELLGAALTRALLKNPDLDLLLAQSSHKESDSQDKVWSGIKHKAIKKFNKAKGAFIQDIEDLMQHYGHAWFHKLIRKKVLHRMKALKDSTHFLSAQDVLKHLINIREKYAEDALSVFDKSFENALDKIIHRYSNMLNTSNCLESALVLGADKSYLDKLRDRYSKQEKALPVLEKELLAHWGTLKRSASHSEFWLSDDQIARLLKNLNLLHTTILPAVQADQHGYLLSQFIRERYIDEYAKHAIERFTLIPLNFSNTHWALAVIEQNPERRSAPRVYFFDSLGQSPAKAEAIYQIIKNSEIYTQPHFVDLSPPQAVQTDSYSCGTWIVNAAEDIVKTRHQSHFKAQSWAQGYSLAEPETIGKAHQANLCWLQSEQSSTHFIIKRLSLQTKPVALSAPSKAEESQSKEPEYSSVQTIEDINEDDKENSSSFTPS